MTMQPGDRHGAVTPATDPEPELLEPDAAGRLVPVRGITARGSRSFATALPSALVAVLVVASLAFGAAGGFDLVAGRGDTAAVTAAPPLATEPAPVTDATAAAPAHADGGDATAEPTDEVATDEPAEEPTVEPTQAPVLAIHLEADAAPGTVRLSWTSCAPDGFAWWKVVRSRDARVTWPLEDDDRLVLASDDPARTSAKDADAPEGRTLAYRVFALVDGPDGWTVACASNTVKVAVPEATPSPDPTPDRLELAITLKEGTPRLTWSACTNDRFDYYKVVASPDEQVRWPAGDNDSLRAAIGDPGETSYWDTDVPAGKTIYYRVFCVQATDAGYITLASSVVKAITTTGDVTPPPDPATIGLEAGLADGGAVNLAWNACHVDGFVYYKVVRSLGTNPSYLPWTDGTELIGVIGDANVTGYQDTDVASGQVWHYRIQALGMWGGQKVVRCQSAVLEVVIP